MYLVLLDVIIPASDAADEMDGYAVVWVNSAKLSDPRRAAVEYASNQGLTVRSVQRAYKPATEELALMTLDQLAARVYGMEKGVWGYFVARVAGTEGAAQPIQPLVRSAPNKPGATGRASPVGRKRKHVAQQPGSAHRRDRKHGHHRPSG